MKIENYRIFKQAEKLNDQKMLSYLKYHMDDDDLAEKAMEHAKKNKCTNMEIFLNNHYGENDKLNSNSACKL